MEKQKMNREDRYNITTKRNQNNVIQFPKNEKPNPKSEAVNKIIAENLIFINENINSKNWDVVVIPDHVLYTLSNFGEVLELEPIVARRLVANLATELGKKRIEITDPFGDLI